MISDDERYKDLSAAITGRIQLIRLHSSYSYSCSPRLPEDLFG